MSGNNGQTGGEVLKLSTKNLIITAVALFVGVLPVCAKINGGISKQHFYDLEKTLMPEITPDTSLQTEKYWEKNVFHVNKYRPIFMLSNKDLYDLKPNKKTIASNRFAIPSVYTVSFKTTNVKKISLATVPQKVPKAQATAQKPNENIDLQSISLYENAKNQGVDSDQKIETAILLKETKNTKNYLLAIDLLDDVTRKEPYNAYAYYIKGELYSAQSDSENAMKSYVEALKLNPYSKQSCLGIAKVLEPTNKMLAQKYYEKAK